MKLLAAVISCLASTALAGQPGVEGMLFARLAGDARGTALGSAGSAVSEGPSALFANPAGAVLRNELIFGTTYVAWMQDFQGGSFSVEVPAGDAADLCGSVFIFTHKPVRITTEENPDGTGAQAGIMWLEADIAGAQWIGEEWSVGAALRYLHEDLGGEMTEAMALDAGFLRVIFPGLTAGGAVRGLGILMRSPATRDPFPMSILAGLRYEFYDSPLRVYAGGRISPAGPSSGGVGLEVGEYFGASVRGMAEMREGGIPGFAVGAGARREMWNLDYTFSPGGVLGSWHRATLSLRFAPRRTP